MEKGPEERLYFDRKELTHIERDIARRRHVERYTMLRQWCYGTVLDCACGCGYGTNLISKNPDVAKVYGVDSSLEAIIWANTNFAESNIKFIQCNMFDAPDLIKNIDVLVSIETIEHIKETDKYIRTIQKLNPEILILSYPTKKSTHYNKYHYYDFNDDQIRDLFSSINYRIYREIYLYHEVAVLSLERL